MALYENVFIVRPNLLPSQVQELIANYKKVIEERGGSVPKTEYWGLKKMAYEIKKNARAHYVLLNIDAPSAAVQEMERQMYINEDVLRYLTLKVEALEDKLSVMMRHKGGRDGDGDDRYFAPEASGTGLETEANPVKPAE